MKKIFAACSVLTLYACLTAHVHAKLNLCSKGCAALSQAETAAGLSGQAASAGAGERSKTVADAAMGEASGAGVVCAQGSGAVSSEADVQSGIAGERKARASSVENLTVANTGMKLPRIAPGVVYAGAAVLGGLQGILAGSLLGAVAGAATGIGAAYLFNKGDHGAGFGFAAGSIVGGVFFGPVGGIVGGLLGGLAGHFLGKMFLG